MMSAAWPSFTAAWYSPSAATILARRSRSASASLAIARCSMIVSDRRDIDRNIVPCDDLLRGDLHGDGAQGHAHHLLDRNEDQRQPRSADTCKSAEKKRPPAFILLQHAK